MSRIARALVVLSLAIAGCGSHNTSSSDGAIGDGGGGDGGIGDGGASDGHSDAADPGMVLFTGDFETGDLSQWYVEQCMPGRITVYSAMTGSAGDPKPHQGTYAAHLHVLDTDTNAKPAMCTSTDNPRAQLSSPAALALLPTGDDRWEAWSVYFPAGFPAITCPAGSTTCTGPFFVSQEDYGPPYGVAPWISWNVIYANGVNNFAFDYSTATDNPSTQWMAPLQTGHWYDLLVHKKLSNVATGGVVEAWVDGAPLTFKSCNCTTITGQTMNTGQSPDSFFLNSYRDHSMFAAADIYFDGARVGTTRASVGE